MSKRQARIGGGGGGGGGCGCGGDEEADILFWERRLGGLSRLSRLSRLRRMEMSKGSFAGKFCQYAFTSYLYGLRSWWVL